MFLSFSDSNEDEGLLDQEQPSVDYNLPRQQKDKQAVGVIARSQESKPSLVFNQYADDKDLFLEQ